MLWLAYEENRNTTTCFEVPPTEELWLAVEENN